VSGPVTERSQTSPGLKTVVIRLLHASDLHIGAALRGVDRYQGAPEIDPFEAAYDAFTALIQAAISESYDGAIIAGDLFDRGDSSGRALRAAQSALDALHEAGIPVALVEGNHDVEWPLSPRLRLASSATRFASDNPGSVIWDQLGIAVHGQSIGAPDDLRNLAAGYPDRIDGLVNVGVLHTSLDGSWSRRVAAPTSLDTLGARGYDYWALGHVHRRLELDASGRPAVYSGSGHARRDTETGGHGYTELTLTGGGIERRVVDTAPVRYEALPLYPGADVAESIVRWFDALDPVAPGTTVIWTLSGGTTDADLRLARQLATEFPQFLVSAPQPSA
jgi:DNA repair exonuclease SbcCD nuclease subunit